MVKKTITVPEGSSSQRHRLSTDEDIIKQAANSFNRKTITAVINNRQILLTPAIIEHIFNVPNDSIPEPCTREQISKYLNENPEKKQKRKAGGQGITVSDLSKQKAYKFAVEAIGLKNCSTYISEKMLGMLLRREFKPNAPINLVQFLLSSVASQTDKYPYMQLYKAGYIWQYIYQVTSSDNLPPPRPLAITLAGEPEDIEGSSGAVPPVPPVTDLVRLAKPVSVDILDSPVRSPSFNVTNFQNEEVESTRLMIKRDKLQQLQKDSVKGKFVIDNQINPTLTYNASISKFILENETVQSLNDSGVLAIQTGWNTIVNGISQMMAVAYQAPEEYRQELDREKQFNAQLLKEKNDLEMKLQQKDQLVQKKQNQLHTIEDELKKAKQLCKDTEFQLLQAQQANVMMQDQNNLLECKLESRQNQLDLKEEQLKRAWRHKELIEQSIMSKYLLQTLQDISTPQGNITLKIADAQQWIKRVRTDLEDKAEIFTQALVNEAVVSYLGDLDNKSDEENDDDEDKDEEDNEDPAGTSGHQGPDDDDNDDADLPGTGPFGGASVDPPPPSTSHTDPPAFTGTDVDHPRDTTALVTYKKRSAAMVLSINKEMSISTMVSSIGAEMAKSTAMVPSSKGKEKAIIGSTDLSMLQIRGCTRNSA
ncbi:hypothetical protein L7F22_056473 [Adiantum nelumboides]|nr:hypothetical protein [Adiantum nelumboides]